MPEKPTCLLSDAVVPTHYGVELAPDLEKFTFRGHVFINLTVTERVREITLHAADLNINVSDVNLWHDEPRYAVSEPTEVRMDPTAETATFVFADAIPVGSYTLEIGYTGTLNDKMVGFYRSKYTTTDGTVKHLATTQFEATDARRALPCVDEPARKATFKVSLVVPQRMTALSNMPIRGSITQEDGLEKIYFERTPVMSTYLLAFIVGELEYIEAFTNNGTRIRVYTVPGKSAHGAFALETAVRVLEFYNEYYGIPYPLPKLDMVAIPDFAAGAMENWGLVTYRENALLLDPVNSSAATKQRVAVVVAHELAHQWFGNLVTMQWWTNLWLNEGFASWMECFTLDHLFPEWDMWTQFVAEDYAGALSLDGLRSSHPIEVPVNHPNEISQIFDAISYSKGACVIRMIHNYIGADAFRAGLQTYLKRHAYGNAVTEDLWQALGEASDKPVCEVMDTWTKQAGYPLITIQWNAEPHTLIASQERFLAGGEKLSDAEREQRWLIPLTYTRAHQAYTTVAGRTLYIPADTLKLNTGQIALARVSYTPEQWRNLIAALIMDELPPVDRYGLMNDALSLARAGHVGTDQLLKLVAAYRTETNYSVWTAVIVALTTVGTLVEETPLNARFSRFARTVLEPIVGKLGWDAIPEEPHTNKLLRSAALGASGAYGNGDVIASAALRFEMHVRGTTSLHPDLRAAVYCTVARYGKRAVFDTLVDLYEAATLQEEKARLLRAMGMFTDTSVLPAVLEYTFNPDKVRPGDFVYTLAAMGAHHTGRTAAWAFMTTNWDRITERYSGGGLKMLAHVVEYTITGFARNADADAIEQFFTEHPAPSATRAIAESLERIRGRARWYERDKDVINKALPD